MNIAITSQNLDPKIVISGISTVVNTIVSLGKDNFHLYEVGYRDGDKKGVKWFFKQIRTFSNFSSFLKKNSIDIVHLNVPFDALGIIREYLLLTIAKKSKKKVLLHIHGGKLLMIPAKNKVIKYFANQLLNQSDKVLVLSKIEQAALITNYNFTDSEYLENAVDTNKIQFELKPHQKETPPAINILYLARITESKGIDDVYSGLKQLREKCSFTFTLCGSGDDAIAVADKFKDFMADDFKFKGAVAGNEWDVISGADIFILPSRHSEGLPMSLLETMAAGLVPVVTNEASMIHVVNDNYNGMIVEKYNGLDICNKLYTLITNPGLLQQYSSSARETIVEKYDTKIFIDKLSTIYLQLMKI
jgi:glycosyltransferase involved in cell wall biosynthesis